MSLNQKQKEFKFSIWQLMLAGGVGANIAELLTIPLDTIKVRLQLAKGTNLSMIDCAKDMLKKEGVGSFYKGLSAGLLRQIFFGSLRIGFFDISMQKLAEKKGSENINLLDRITWGIISGAVAITIANPFDTVKVRFQNDARNATGVPRYKGLFHAMNTIFKEEGLRGFYQSLVPNMLRNSIFNAVELGSYSQVKAYLLKNNIMKDGLPLHFAASAFAGTLTVALGSPFDVIKAAVQDGKNIDGKKIPYSSVIEAVGDIYKRKGPKGFYVGLNANFQRLVSWNISMFVVREQILSKIKSSQFH